jgi:hypothetical protein
MTKPLGWVGRAALKGPEAAAFLLQKSFDVPEEFGNVDVRVAQRAFQRVTIYFIVKREHDPSSVGMFHLNVAALAVNLNEAKTSQRGQDLPARKQR